jgi:alpha-beta hydrolase superfamily lysophospholipase
LVDMLQIFNGTRLYDPARLTMPLLAIRGAEDTTSTATDCARLLEQAASTSKRYCQIEPGSHFLCIEKNRVKLYDELTTFLEAG